MNQKVIGANLRRIRQAFGLSQEKIAELAGISRIAYRKIEMGESTPKVSTLQNIANGLGVKLQDLFIPVRTLEKVRFRASKRMNSREHIINEVAKWLEDYNDLENILNDRIDYKFKDLAQHLSTLSPFQDHLCLILAKKNGWTCVTNDKALFVFWSNPTA